MKRRHVDDHEVQVDGANHEDEEPSSHLHHPAAEHRSKDTGQARSSLKPLSIAREQPTYRPLTNSFITDGRLVKVRIGMRAKGNCVRRSRNICLRLSLFGKVLLCVGLRRDEPDLQALQHIEEVVHARQVLDVLEDGNQQSRSDGEGAGQQYASKAGPAQV